MGKKHENEKKNQEKQKYGMYSPPRATSTGIL
jgi:hypothetical protein